MGMKSGSKSARNYKTWIERGFSMEDAIFESRKRMPGTIEYFQYFKGFTEDIATQMSKDFWAKKAVTLANLIDKYGEIIGTDKFNNYRNKQAIKNTFEYKRAKYGWNIEQFNEYNHSRANTKDNFLKRYGDTDGLEKWNTYCKLQAVNGSSLEWFVDKYGYDDGYKIHQRVNFMKSHTYESYLIRSDGDVELANKLFLDYLRSSRTSVSKISQELFKKLLIDDELALHSIYFSDLNQEWFFNYSGFEHTIFVDFFDRTTGKIIEFFGDYWHANPIIYSDDDIVKYPGKVHIAAKEIWQKDQKRLDIIKKVPYIKDVMVIWEHDYKTNPVNIITQCKKFLKS